MPDTILDVEDTSDRSVNKIKFVLTGVNILVEENRNQQNTKSTSYILLEGDRCTKHDKSGKTYRKY